MKSIKLTSKVFVFFIHPGFAMRTQCADSVEQNSRNGRKGVDAQMSSSIGAESGAASKTVSEGASEGASEGLARRRAAEWRAVERRARCKAMR